MQFSRTFCTLVCLAALAVVGCSQSDSTKTTPISSKPATDGKATTPESKPAATADSQVTPKLPETSAGSSTAAVTDAKPSTAVAEAKPAATNGAATNGDSAKAKEKEEAPPVAPQAPSGDQVAVKDEPAKEETPITDAAKSIDEAAAPAAPPETVPELTIGVAAPLLANETWVKGDAVEKFEPGKVYVVEFWATWCGPCIASMPHVSKLQDELGDKVRFIGVSIDDGEKEVTEFLDSEFPQKELEDADAKDDKDAKKDTAKKQWKDVITYTLAFDKEKQAGKDYLEAAGQNGIPCAFIVGRDGKIDWIGHPMQIDEPLQQVVADKWDRAKALAALQEEQRIAREEQEKMRKLQEQQEREPAVPDLTIGGEAAPLADAEWIKGDAVEKFEPGKLYVVEFWATWCGPCIQSMPHIAKLQTELGDKVQFIGVSVDDSDKEVKEFMDKEQSKDKLWKDVLTYTIAFDKDKKINRAYMEAAGQNGIPCAFVVGRDGKIDWIGHPMQIDEPLAQIVADKWDRAKVLAQMERQKNLQKAFRSGDWDTTLKILDELIAEEPKNSQWLFAKVQVLQQAGKTDEAKKLMPELVKNSWDNWQPLIQLAYGIAMSDDDNRDYELALKAAERANELTEGKHPAVLMVIAKLYHDSGKLDQAIEWQKKAVTASNDDPDFAATLKQYEDEKAKGGGADESKPKPDGEKKDEVKKEEEKKAE